MKDLDEIDCEILNMLQVNCRATFREISDHINLSADAVKNRINKMLENKVFHPKIQIRPRHLGYHNVVEVKVKLKFISESKLDEFITFLIKHPNIAEIFSISGKWDFSIVIIAKDANELGKITHEIRIKFGDMIRSWIESLTTDSYKFEYYDMRKLMGFKPTRVKFDFFDYV
ncbi:MAG: Lrp/AsnC family transcriptional regulator [Promethearchaeota archaeon]